MVDYSLSKGALKEIRESKTLYLKLMIIPGIPALIWKLPDIIEQFRLLQ